MSFKLEKDYRTLMLGRLATFGRLKDIFHNSLMGSQVDLNILKWTNES